jgi:hypothetical protein
MFGLFVAMAMLVGSRYLLVELERLQAEGKLDVSIEALREVVSNLTTTITMVTEYFSY